MVRKINHFDAIGTYVAGKYGMTLIYYQLTNVAGRKTKPTKTLRSRVVLVLWIKKKKLGLAVSFHGGIQIGPRL